MDGTGGGVSDALWASLAVQVLWIGLAVAGARWLGPPSVAAHLGLERGRLHLAPVLGLVAGFLAWSVALHLVLDALAVRDTGSLAEIDRTVRETSGPTRGLAALAIGLAPGVAEELLFRGLVQRTVARLAPVAVAIAVSTLAFAVAHADAVHAAAALPLGAYLGLAAWIADSTRPTMAAHVANNLLGVAFLTLPPVSVPAVPGGVAAAAAPLLLAGAAALWWARRQARTTGRRQGEE